jgi:hypothetical protein
MMSLIMTLLNLIYLIKMYQVCYTTSTLFTTLFTTLWYTLGTHFTTLLAHFSLHFWYTLGAHFTMLLVYFHYNGDTLFDTC